MKFRMASVLYQEWLRRRNPTAYARVLGVKVGKGCRLIGLERGTFGSEPYLVSIGEHVTVTAGVRFITHDGSPWVFRDKHPDIDIVAPIAVGNNVFIGYRAIILRGVTVNDNSIIGAGAVVTRDVPSNTVVAGVPAKPIMTLDEYWERIQAKIVHTHTYSRAEKQQALKKMFSDNDSE